MSLLSGERAATSGRMVGKAIALLGLVCLLLASGSQLLALGMANAGNLALETQAAERARMAGGTKSIADLIVDTQTGGSWFEARVSARICSWFQGSLFLEARSSTAHQGLGTVYSLLGHTSAAEHELRQALDKGPSRVMALAALAALVYSAPRVQTANMPPRVAAQVCGLLQAWAVKDQNTGLPDSAMAKYRAALGMDNLSAACKAMCMSRLGELALYHKHDPLEAETLFRDALVLVPSDPEARMGLAHSLMYQGRHSLAIPELQASLTLKPTSRAWQLLGEAYRASGAAREAAQAYGQSLSLDPRNTWALEGLGEALWQDGHQAQAIALWKRALQIDPNFAPASRALQGVGR